jgi:hypothetical protein
MGVGMKKIPNEVFHLVVGKLVSAILTAFAFLIFAAFILAWVILTIEGHLRQW